MKGDIMKRKISCGLVVFLLVFTLTSLPLQGNEVFAESTITKDVTVLGTSDQDTVIKNVPYNKAYFSEDSSDYNQQLAKLALVFSTAAYGNSPVYIEKTLSDFGFLNDKVYDQKSYEESAKSGSNSVGYSFACKRIGVGNQTYTLLAVVIRGTSGDNEWMSNFNINNSGNSPTVHEGFGKAEKSLLANLNKYAESLKLNPSTTKVLITGHSRGAAVANLLAADLSDTEQLADVSNIYGYTFATPNVARIEDNTYLNIFNAVNPADIVTMIPLQKWGYGKYGVTYTLPEASQLPPETITSSQKLLGQLETMAPTLQEFYNNKLAILLVQGNMIQSSITDMHYPATYLNWLDQVDSSKLTDRIKEIQLKMIPDNTYA